MRPAVAFLAATLALLAGEGVPARAQRPPEDGVRLLVARIQRVVQDSDRAGYSRFLTDAADRERADAFARAEFVPGVTRAVLQERDRAALPGTLPGNGYRLTVDAFIETGNRARIATWRFDVKRVGGGANWALDDQDRLSSVENLNRLSLDPNRQFAARGLRIRDEDFELTFETGAVFVSSIPEGATALVFVGRGTMQFSPAPATERSQVKIFGGSERLSSAFDVVYLRVAPADFDHLIAAGQLVAEQVDPRQFRRADAAFRDDSTKSYSVDVGDLSRENWSLVPGPGDLVADVHTRRGGILTYTRSSAEPEDVNFFDRRRRKTIALYASRQKQMERRDLPAGPDGDFRVLDYNVDVSVDPDRPWIDAQARMRVRVQADMLNTLTMRLADALVVQSVTSPEYGRLFSLRVRNQGVIVISLPATVRRDAEFGVTVTYAGRLEPQHVESESLNLQQPGVDSAGILTAEPHFLYTGATNWYPQAGASGYSTATLRVTVPASLDCVATGVPDDRSPQLVPSPAKPSDARKQYVFTASDPIRYLAFVVSRFADARNITIGLPRPDPAVTGPPLPGSLSLVVQTTPRQVGRGRELGDQAVDIALFYQSIVGASTYPAFTIALVESDLPGGHSPGYFAVLNQPLPSSPFSWRNDPASFEGFPEFFLAHEMAHQWWGQGVGWRTYHDQWLSEGFAQYFAALYARRVHGAGTFASIMRQMRHGSIALTNEGPISLGYRLGHIQDDPRIFRTLVYNKAAVVLHMLSQLLGEDVFQRGLARFYRARRFQNARTSDLRAALEAESGRPLDRFFAQWIDGATLPRLALSSRVEADDLILRIDQAGELFEVPVGVKVRFAGGDATDVVVPVSGRFAELRVPLAGRTVARVDANREDLWQP